MGLRTIHAVVSVHVDAPAGLVRSLYEDPANWARLFPATIAAARVLRRDGHSCVIEVDHREGRVINVLHTVSPTRVELLEQKRRYQAAFTSDFEPEGAGSRYTLTASVRLRWPYCLATPFLKALVLARMRRHAVEPLVAAAEASAAEAPGAASGLSRRA